MKSIFIVAILLNILKVFNCSSVSVTGYCGDPGHPAKSQLSPTQSIYNEDEAVVYKCDDYISLKQYRKCVKGKWIGNHAVCGNSFRNNDINVAKIYNKQNNTLIKEYNISEALEPFAKFGNSFIAERYGQPLRAYGAKSYRIELYLQSKSLIQLVRISLSVVNHLYDERIRRTKWNITDVRVSPYRKCSLHSHSAVSPWAHNSTRFDYWYSCESLDAPNFAKELKNKSNMIAIDTEAEDVVDMDLATFILADQYTNDGDPHQPICGTPEIPIGLDTHVINHHTRYAFKCAQGFSRTDGSGAPIDFASHELFCDTDMKWKGSLPDCMPQKTCKKFELTEKHLTEVYHYEKVYYYNDSVWFAIEGTKAHFRCKDEIQIFVGKEFRVCGKDGEWSDSLPNCLDTEKESALNITTISIIIMLTLILTFSLSAILVFCVLRMKRMKRNKLNENGLRQSNIYDDYDIHGVGMYGKNMDETYETVDEERYADNRQMQRTVAPVYTDMTAGGPYKTNYNDKNVYDDCVGYETQHHNPNASDLDDSYVVMKMH